MGLLPVFNGNAVDRQFTFPNAGAAQLPEDNNNRIWTDPDVTTPLDIQGLSLTVENATIRCATIRKTTTDTLDPGYDMTNATVIFDTAATQNEATLGAQVNGTQVHLGGVNTFNNVSFVRDASALTTSQRLIIGGFQANGGSSTFDNCSFISLDENNPIVILNEDFDNLTFSNNSFSGAVAGQFLRGFTSERSTWASTGANDGGAGTFNGDQYFARCIHTGIADNNNVVGAVSTNRLPNNSAVFFLDDDMSAPVALDTHLQMNENAAAILVNCTTGLNSPDLPISFHRAPSANQPIGIYHMVGWKPEWMDITAEVPVRDVRVSFGNEAYLVPEYTNDAAFLQGLESNRIVTNTVVAFDPLNPNFRGYWIESARITYDDITGTVDNFVGPANALYTARSYTHVLQDVNLTGIRNREFTNALGQTDFKVGDVTNGVDNFTSNPIGVFADADLNGVAYAAANNTITDIDDTYSRAKRDWYDSDPFAVLGVENMNGILTFDRPVLFNDATTNTYQEGLIRLNETFAGGNLTGGTLFQGFSCSDIAEDRGHDTIFDQPPGEITGGRFLLNELVNNIFDVTSVIWRNDAGTINVQLDPGTGYTFDPTTNEVVIPGTIGEASGGWTLTIQANSNPSINYNGLNLNGVTVGDGFHSNFGYDNLNITTTAGTRLVFDGTRVDRDIDGNRILDATQWIVNGVEPLQAPTNVRGANGFTEPFQVNLFQETADALRVSIGGTINDITYNILTASHDITAADVLDTNGVSVGGYFAVLQFNAATSQWIQVGSTEDVAPGASVTPIRISEGGDYIAIWRPKSTEYSTTIHEFTSNLTTTDITVAPQEITSALKFNPDTTSIPNPVGQTTGRRWTIDWTITGTELLGTISGTLDGEDGEEFPNQVQTQLLLMEAYLDIDYITVLINYMTANDAIARNSRDYIFPLSPAVTAIDGEFVQLDTGTGGQQVLSSVVGRDANGNDTSGTLANMISAQITGVEDGTSDMISFPAVRFVPNQDGISGAEVLASFNAAIAEIERGVGYTVQQIDANPIIQAPTGNPLYDSNTDYPL